MKKILKNIMVLMLGLLLSGLPAAAGSWNSDVSLVGGSTYTLGGGGVNVPSNATIGWYAYAYGSDAAARVTVYVNGNLAIDQTVYVNGSNSASQPAGQAGTVNCYLEAWRASSGSGNAGCGVSVGW
jgi:hypothetical protein